MVATLLAVAFAALPPSGGGTWLELSAGLRLDVGTLHREPTTMDPLTSGGWSGGGGAAAIEVFGRRVVDDDAAPALQPFLQRAARFGLEGGGGQVHITFPIYTLSPVAPSALLVRYQGTEESGRVAARAEGYLHRWLYGALRRRYGLSVGVEGAHGAFVDSPVVHDRAGGHLGISAWLTPRLAMTLAYAPAWQHPAPISGFGIVEPDGSSVAHMITLSATARP